MTTSPTRTGQPTHMHQAYIPHVPQPRGPPMPPSQPPPMFAQQQPPQHDVIIVTTTDGSGTHYSMPIAAGSNIGLAPQYATMNTTLRPQTGPPGE